MECSFCDFWPNAAPRKDELTVDDYRRVAKELTEMGCFLVSVEGGEPLIRPDLVEIVHAFAQGHIPALYTNGWYVTLEKAHALWGAGLVHASVSIDYPDAARHDMKRRLVGTTDRAWRAVEILRDTAPRGGKQVHVMTVLMEDNWRDLDALLEKSAAYGVGHQVTLLSVGGYRRGKKGSDALPAKEIAGAMQALWKKHKHLRFFSEYFDRMGAFLEGRAMPTCHAGVQSFNIDHVGNVSPCIEKIDRSVGNVKTESVVHLHSRLGALKDEVARCQDCWTACRGFQQALGGGGTVRNWLEMGARMRTM